MAKTIDNYIGDIEHSLRVANRYNQSLALQVRTLATALVTLDKATKQIECLDEVTVLEETRYGHKLAPHPAFKVQKDAQDSVTRQMKALGLTTIDLMGEIEEDPLIELTEEVRNVSKPKIIKPRKRNDRGGKRQTKTS